MSVGPSLVDDLLQQEGSAHIKQRISEAVLLVDKLGSPEWKFEAGRFTVRLDFRTRTVAVSHESGRSDWVDLDLLLRRLQIGR